MKKKLLIILLLTVNIYANKNWIKFDEEPTKAQTQKASKLKMYTPQSSLKNINKTTEAKPYNNPDRQLINAFKEFKNMAQKLQTKIKN